jgi:hypothetical protein
LNFCLSGFAADMQHREVAGAALAVLLLLPGVAAARWYQVEVVVFRHLEGQSAGGEAWPDLTDLPEFGRAMELIVTLPEMSDEPPPLAQDSGSDRTPIAFELLDDKERKLNGVQSRLQRSGEYEPLLFAAWRQPSFGVARAKRIYLSDVYLAARGGRTSVDAKTADRAPAMAPRAEGVVRVKVGRLLHVDVDFLYYHEGSPVRLTETRKLKLREIHYFDHPLFGVIVQVSPWVLPHVDPKPEPDDLEDEMSEDEVLSGKRP